MDWISLSIIYTFVFGSVAWIAIELFVEQYKIFKQKRLQMRQRSQGHSNEKDPGPSDEDQSPKGPLAAA
jgi:hypothetical protein